MLCPFVNSPLKILPNKSNDKCVFLWYNLYTLIYNGPSFSHWINCLYISVFLSPVYKLFIFIFEPSWQSTTLFTHISTNDEYNPYTFF